ncbi:hypothetical protein Ahy_A02g009155 [Arachis hypogaea]|uniref:Aminotransferase-like plant mobile domain-containing protein n=1 Tax=Arachis hypogaea TaxID=3818 RepID=A0A445EG54_ARAHY|nr:hypothetical protein Ahy_A02g009155 [Arachis hypogaea]
MEDDPNCLYRLDEVAHIAGTIHLEPHRCISSMRWQHAWVWFEELLGVLSPANCIDKFTVKCTWFQETFSELLHGADDETVRRYARAYIMMLLSTQLFEDKSGYPMLPD